MWHNQIDEKAMLVLFLLRVSEKEEGFRRGEQAGERNRGFSPTLIKIEIM
ncbi:MAG: hypothetical protein HC888_02545 [Candidatus Competibacteraceae bacterium]|nr:hypothetical protein [Candidatus Competibacteraceae bacterium]